MKRKVTHRVKPRLLSEPRKDIMSWAVCSFCEECFMDDVYMAGSVLCPNRCGNVVMRGFSEPAGAVK